MNKLMCNALREPSITHYLTVIAGQQCEPSPPEALWETPWKGEFLLVLVGDLVEQDGDSVLGNRD